MTLRPNEEEFLPFSKGDPLWFLLLWPDGTDEAVIGYSADLARLTP